MILETAIPLPILAGAGDSGDAPLPGTSPPHGASPVPDPAATPEEPAVRGASDAPPAGRLFQVIVNVRDMARQVAFWRDVMGFRVLYPAESADWSREFFVRLDAGGMSLALHGGREAPNSGDEPRLSFRTEDLAGTRERLVMAGARLSEVRSPAPGIFVVDGRDPEGNVFHLESHDAGPER